MSVLFVNISSDRIQCVVDGKETILPHGDLEKTIADFMYSGALKGITEAFVINWPGSFTHLRSATLALNMYNFLNQNSITFYSIDKLSLYKKLSTKNIIPAVGYIYIGQRKNWRKIDLETMSHETVQELSDEDAFVDELFDGEKTDKMIHFTWQEDSLHIAYAGAEHRLAIDELGIESVKSLSANYMMDPNVTIKEF